jgi:hopanoid biosynthesis associated RND transporter like protein HpnN
MSAEGMPPETVLGRLLRLLVRLAIFRPKVTIAIGLLGIVASLYLSSTRLVYHTSRAALLDPRQEYQQRWQRYVDEFGEQEDVVVVVQGEKRDAIIPALDAVVRELSAQPKYFQNVLHEIDLTKFRAKGLYFRRTEDLQQIEGMLNDVEPIVRGGWEWLSPGAMAAGMNAKLQQVGPDQFPLALSAAQLKLTQLGESLVTALSTPGAYISPWAELSGSDASLMQMSSQRLIIGNDRIGLVLLKLTKDKSQEFIQNTESIAALRALVGRIQSQSTGVKIGLTGLPILEHDEMKSSESSISVATVLSFLGVFLVLVAALGGIRHSLMVMGSLFVGLVCSVGYTTLVVGHLNILSSAFGAILIGLGINYAIYFVAQYLRLREKGELLDQALLTTASSVGPGIVISALSTAIAFLAAGFTEFTGVAELGKVAGGGIVLCLLAAMTILPAIIKACDGSLKTVQMPVPLNFHAWLRPLVARPRFAIVAAVVMTGILALGLGRLRYDYNLLRLQPVGLESVELEQKLLAETKESVYFALSMAKTPDEAAALKKKFLDKSLVERVDDVATYLVDEPEKRPIIERIRNRVSALPLTERPPQIPVASPTELGQSFSAVQPLLAANVQMAKFQQQLFEIRGLLDRLPEAEYRKRISEYQQRVATDLLERLRLLQSVANPEPPNVSDLPPALAARFVGNKGSHLLRIYVKGDFWNIDNMREFVKQVREVDPNVTGNPVQIYEASQQMRDSYERAAFYALLAILPVLALNFGNWRSMLLATLPLIADLLQTFGLMGLLDLPLNSANMIGLSLMLGMGMENGILITQDFCRQRGRYRMSAATGVAVVINTLTTMVGFAVLMIAAHRGLQSLGRMLSLGMACSLISALLILPTLMTWITRNRKDAEAEDENQDDDESSPHDGSLDLETHFEEEFAAISPVYRRDACHVSLGGVHRPPRGDPWEYPFEREDESAPMYGGA